MNEYTSKLKQVPTDELRMLLSSGICGNEYKRTLTEYMTRPDKANISPGRKLKNRKLKPQVDAGQISKDMITTLNMRQLKSLMAAGLDGKKRKLVYTEYLRRIHKLRNTL